jgi:hypothetical protein
MNPPLVIKLILLFARAEVIDNLILPLYIN